MCYQALRRLGLAVCAGDAYPHDIFCLFSVAYAQSPTPALALMPSTERGLILFAGQQSLTHAQVAELPPVAAFRLSRPGSIRGSGLAPQDGTPVELNSPFRSILLRMEPAHRSR